MWRSAIDMLTALDALRWGRADLYTLVPDGQARIRAMLDVGSVGNSAGDAK